MGYHLYPTHSRTTEMSRPRARISRSGEGLESRSVCRPPIMRMRLGAQITRQMGSL
jgi:hypothetical protein